MKKKSISYFPCFSFLWRDCSSLICSLNSSLKNLPSSSRVISPLSFSSSTEKTSLCLSSKSSLLLSSLTPLSSPLTKTSTSSFSSVPLLSVSMASKTDLLMSANLSSLVRMSTQMLDLIHSEIYSPAKLTKTFFMQNN